MYRAYHNEDCTKSHHITRIDNIYFNYRRCYLNAVVVATRRRSDPIDCHYTFTCIPTYPLSKSLTIGTAYKRHMRATAFVYIASSQAIFYSVSLVKADSELNNFT